MRHSEHTCCGNRCCDAWCHCYCTVDECLAEPVCDCGFIPPHCQCRTSEVKISGRFCGVRTDEDGIPFL